MPHPRVDNPTPLIAEPLFLEDEDGQPCLTMVVKASFLLLPDRSWALAAEQVPLLHAGEPWEDDAASYRYEPEITPFKPATDVVVIGHAHAPDPRTAVLDVGLRVGPLTKIARVFGDRYWVRAGVEWRLTAPRPFERVPLRWEYAFGGVELPAMDLRNPVGRGYYPNGPQESDPAPNIEDPRALIDNWRDQPAPVGFGFTCPHWQPRAALAGTFDEAWAAKRKPRLPLDFDLRHHCGAAPGLIAPGYLRGDESVELHNLSPEGQLSFVLPGLPPPTLELDLRFLLDAPPQLALDTIILEPDARRLILLWRTRVPLVEGPHDLLGYHLRSNVRERFATVAAEEVR